jgi:hypothetical protein
MIPKIGKGGAALQGHGFFFIREESLSQSPGRLALILLWPRAGLQSHSRPISDGSAWPRCCYSASPSTHHCPSGSWQSLLPQDLYMSYFLCLEWSSINTSASFKLQLSFLFFISLTSLLVQCVSVIY